jgi:hypothetical protein
MSRVRDSTPDVPFSAAGRRASTSNQRVFTAVRRTVDPSRDAWSRDAAVAGGGVDEGDLEMRVRVCGGVW